jgi:hypothetical protein
MASRLGHRVTSGMKGRGEPLSTDHSSRSFCSNPSTNRPANFRVPRVSMVHRLGITPQPLLGKLLQVAALERPPRPCITTRTRRLTFEGPSIAPSPDRRREPFADKGTAPSPTRSVSRVPTSRAKAPQRGWAGDGRKHLPAARCGPSARTGVCAKPTDRAGCWEGSFHGSESRWFPSRESSSRAACTAL